VPRTWSRPTAGALGAAVGISPSVETVAHAGVSVAGAVTTARIGNRRRTRSVAAHSAPAGLAHTLSVAERSVGTVPVIIARSGVSADALLVAGESPQSLWTASAKHTRDVTALIAVRSVTVADATGVARSLSGADCFRDRMEGTSDRALVTRVLHDTLRACGGIPESVCDIRGARAGGIEHVADAVASAGVQKTTRTLFFTQCPAVARNALAPSVSINTLVALALAGCARRADAKAFFAKD